MYRTTLTRHNIGSPIEAAKVCGRQIIRGGIREVPLVLIPSMGLCDLIVSVPEGFISIVHKCGEFVSIWGAGFHVRSPWVEVAFMIGQQYITYDSPVTECPTMDNVMVEIDVSVVFHIKDTEDDVKAFIYSLGPEKLDDMLQAFQVETVRTMARQKKYSNIYDLMDTEELTLPDEAPEEREVAEIPAEAIVIPGAASPAAMEMTTMKDKEPDVDDVNEQLDKTKREMNEKLAPYGVKVYSITITNVKLPGEFRSQMENATTYETLNRKQQAQQQYEMLKIKNEEKRHQAEQRADEDLKQMESTNKMRLAQEEKVTETFQAETNALIANIKEKMNSELREIKADADLAVAKLETEKELLLTRIQAETSAEITQLNAEIEAFSLAATANAKKEVASIESQALSMSAEAEEVAATALVAKRDFEAKMAQLRILKNLAVNEQVAVSGSNKDSVVAQIVASQNASVALGINQ